MSGYAKTNYRFLITNFRGASGSNALRWTGGSKAEKLWRERNYEEIMVETVKPMAYNPLHARQGFYLD